MPTVDVVVVGQIARDVVLVVDELPEAGHAGWVRSRREVLGGKGANQAVALSQLGVRVALVGVVGDDEVGERLLRQARLDRIDVSGVVRRGETDTALIVELLDPAGRWRYLQHLPDGTLLTEADIGAVAGLLREATAVSVQLQQTSAAALAAAQCAAGAGARVILDGAPADDHRREALLAAADVLRADAHEAELLTGRRLPEPADAASAARSLLKRGPSLVAMSVKGEGNAFAWEGGEAFLPLIDTEVVDTTGAGDAFTAGLTAALVRGEDPRRAARLAVAAAGATVGHPGGRPHLSPETVRAHLAKIDSVTGQG